MKDKTITNPMLVGALELKYAENTPDHRKMVMEEILHAKFLSPVILSPLPKPDEKGAMKLTPETKVQLPMLTAKDGKHYFMAFTDISELDKWSRGTKHTVFGFTFNDYVGMLRGSDSDGVVINPMGKSMVLPRQMVDDVMGGQS